MKRTQRLLAALDSREHSNQAELARASSKVSKGRGAVASLDALIEEIRTHANGGMAQVLRDGPCSATEVLETEHRVRRLRQELVKLTRIREQAIVELNELVEHRQLAANRWRSSHERLRHVQSLDRRRAVRASVRLMDWEEMEHADRRLSARSST